jgi:uncharacterized membrane protein
VTRPGRLLSRPRYGFAGLVGATLFLCLSLTPSLLPRGFLVQGLVSGVLSATGYGFGVLAAWLARHASPRPLPRVTPVAWYCLAAVAAVATVVFLILDSGWQRSLYRPSGPPL